MLTDQMLVVIGLSAAILIIAIEYVYLLCTSCIQEKRRTEQSRISQEIDKRLGQITSITNEARIEREIGDLLEYAGKHHASMLILCDKLLGLSNKNVRSERRQFAIHKLIEMVKPVRFYQDAMRNRDVYQKAYFCGKIAGYSGMEAIEDIRDLTDETAGDVAYHAVLALSALGVEDAVVDFFMKYENNRNYSHRMLLHILDCYAGDIVSLAKALLETGNEYIRSCVIKGIAGHKIKEFEIIYRIGLGSKNISMKIACIRALGKLGNPTSEHAIITESYHKNWVIRAAAVNELKNFVSKNSFKAVMAALTDQAWQVRHNAAQALVYMDKTSAYVKSVLESYDKYAIEAVECELQRASVNARKELLHT